MLKRQVIYPVNLATRNESHQSTEAAFLIVSENISISFIEVSIYICCHVMESNHVGRLLTGFRTNRSVTDCLRVSTHDPDSDIGIWRTKQPFKVVTSRSWVTPNHFVLCLAPGAGIEPTNTRLTVAAITTLVNLE